MFPSSPGWASLAPTHVPLSQYTATLHRCWLVVWVSGVPWIPWSDKDGQRRRWEDGTFHLQQNDCSTASSHADFSSVGMVKDKLRNQSGQAENAAPCWQIWLKWWSSAVSRICGLHDCRKLMNASMSSRTKLNAKFSCVSVVKRM